MSEWNAGLYESTHSFVWQRGRGLVEMLAPQRGERILDVGCGTGQLTAELAQSGAAVLGVDSSESMIEQARRNFPAVPFEAADARSLDFHEEFEAVFSNAVLHWVLEPEAAAGAVRAIVKTHKALKADVNRATAIGRKLFPPAEAELIAELIRRDLPFYDATISAPFVAAMNDFARDVGALKGNIAYDQVVATQFSPLWKG